MATKPKKSVRSKKPVSTKKPSKAGANNRLLGTKRRRIALALLVVVLFGAIGTAWYVKSQAAPSVYTFVCNSSASDGRIKVWDYSKYWFPNYGTATYTLSKGGCTGDLLNNNHDNLRVDVEPDTNDPDIDSYKIGEISQGYGPCHVGERSDSNPPDSYNYNGIRYRTYRSSTCL